MLFYFVVFGLCFFLFCGSSIVGWLVLEVFFLCFMCFSSLSLVELSGFFVFCVCDIIFSLIFLFGLLCGSDLIGLFFLAGKLGLFPFWFWFFRFVSSLGRSAVFFGLTFFKIPPVAFLCCFSLSSQVWWLCLFNLCVLVALFSFFWNNDTFVAVLSVYSAAWLWMACVSIFLGVCYFVFYVISLALVLFLPFSSWLTLVYYFGFPLFAVFFVKLFIGAEVLHGFLVWLVFFSSSVVGFFFVWIIFPRVFLGGFLFSFIALFASTFWL